MSRGWDCWLPPHMGGESIPLVAGVECLWARLGACSLLYIYPDYAGNLAGVCR